MEFQPFPKIPRYSRDCIITEKIDGTNAQIFIYDSFNVPNGNVIISPDPSIPWIMNDEGIAIAAGSRNRWLTSEKDNHGFAKWAKEHTEELLKLGPGRHFGEWWGKGIQRGYGLTEKRFSLFNVIRWNAAMFGQFKIKPWLNKGQIGPRPVYSSPPQCCSVVPVIAYGEHTSTLIEQSLTMLRECGSYAVEGYTNPEGVVIYHVAGNTLFKKTLKDDQIGKGE